MSIKLRGKEMHLRASKDLHLRASSEEELHVLSSQLRERFVRAPDGAESEQERGRVRGGRGGTVRWERDSREDRDTDRQENSTLATH
jgi:hypothetical protein